MTDRLSTESVKRVLHQGHRSLPSFLPSDISELVVVDIERILSQPQAMAIIQALPVQQIYFALKANRLESAEDVLPLLSRDQLVRLMDYDTWSHEVLDRSTAFKWLSFYRAQGPDAIASRFRQLDEEYQVGLIQGQVRVFDEEEREFLSEEHKDRLTAMPCNKLFYELLFDRSEDADFFEELLNSAMAHDMAYAYSLVTHAAYAVPHEDEFQLAQFRKARLEEDGFSTLEEAERSFTTINLASLKDKWKHLSTNDAVGAALAAVQFESSFLDQVRIFAHEEGRLDISQALTLQQSFVSLANSLCAAADVGPDDPAGLCRVLEQAKGVVSLALEFLADRNVSQGVTILLSEHPKTLFRTGITLVDLVREKALLHLELSQFADVEKLRKMLRLRRWGEMLWLLETSGTESLGLQLTEVLKGLFNRFPMYPISGLKPNEAKFVFKPIDGLTALNDTTTALLQLFADQKH